MTIGEFGCFLSFLTQYNSIFQTRVSCGCELCRRICTFMSCFDWTLGHLQLPSRPHTTPEWIYFRACLRVRRSPPMLPLNIRTDLMGDISNRPMYVLAVLNTGRWGGRGGGRLPTVFNLAATLLAFRADDKEMNDPRVLSHSLNVEFRWYPSALSSSSPVFF